MITTAEQFFSFSNGADGCRLITRVEWILIILCEQFVLLGIYQAENEIYCINAAG